MRFTSFLSGGFTTMAVINPPESKLAKRTSVNWSIAYCRSTPKKRNEMAIDFVHLLYLKYIKFSTKLRKEFDPDNKNLTPMMLV